MVVTIIENICYIWGIFQAHWDVKHLSKWAGECRLTEMPSSIHAHHRGERLPWEMTFRWHHDIRWNRIFSETQLQEERSASTSQHMRVRVHTADSGRFWMVQAAQDKACGRMWEMGINGDLAQVTKGHPSRPQSLFTQGEGSSRHIHPQVQRVRLQKETAKKEGAC